MGKKNLRAQVAGSMLRNLAGSALAKVSEGEKEEINRDEVKDAWWCVSGQLGWDARVGKECVTDFVCCGHDTNEPDALVMYFLCVLCRFASFLLCRQCFPCWRAVRGTGPFSCHLP